MPKMKKDIQFIMNSLSFTNRSTPPPPNDTGPIIIQTILAIVATTNKAIIGHPFLNLCTNGNKK